MERMDYSAEIANAVKKCLDENEMTYRFDERRGVIEFKNRIRGSFRVVECVIDIGTDDLSVLAFCPVCADEEDHEVMARMAEFICRANYGMKNGCFEMDFDDGEIRFRSFIDCEDQLPGPECINNSIRCALFMLDRYGDGIVNVLYRDMPAEEAVKRCEKTQEDEVRSVFREMGVDAPSGSLGDLLSGLAERLGITGDTEEADPDAEETVFGTDEMDETDDDALSLPDPQNNKAV